MNSTRHSIFPCAFDLMGSNASVGSSPLLGRGSPTAFESSIKAENVLFKSGHAIGAVPQQSRYGSRGRAKAGRRDTADSPRPLLFTLPSTPMLYYGEEIGIRGDKTDGDKSVRGPMDWYAAETGAGMTTWYKPTRVSIKRTMGFRLGREQAGTTDSLLNHYQKLSQLRRAFRRCEKRENLFRLRSRKTRMWLCTCAESRTQKACWFF